MRGNKNPDYRQGFLACGERGIRTPGPQIKRTTVFETAAFDHSATSPFPEQKYQFIYVNKNMPGIHYYALAM